MFRKDIIENQKINITMAKEINTIGVLTSGGDAPGMNAAIRAVVRTALAQGKKVKGIMRGYQGLLDEEIIDMDKHSVSDIIQKGGTILGTARCLETDEFNYETGRRIAHTKAQSKIFRIANEFFATINDRATQDLMRCECNCIASEWQCYDHIAVLSGNNTEEVGLTEIDE